MKNLGGFSACIPPCNLRLYQWLDINTSLQRSTSWLPNARAFLGGVVIGIKRRDRGENRRGFILAGWQVLLFKIPAKRLELGAHVPNLKEFHKSKSLKYKSNPTENRIFEH